MKKFQKSIFTVLIRWRIIFTLVIMAGLQITSYGQLANINLTKGWATFGQALPQGVASSGLQVGDLLTQTDVKTRWPDGSIRFAIVTVKVNSDGQYDLHESSLKTETFEVKVPEASVNLTSTSIFQPIGTFEVKSETLKIILSDLASADVVAGMMRVDNGTDDDPNAKFININDPDFSSGGTWNEADGLLWSHAGTGANTVTWTFSNLALGSYRISTLWNAWPAHANDTPYSIYDGSNLIETVKVDQRIAPAGIVFVSKYTSSLSKDISDDLWLDGPLVKEWRQLSAPLLSNGQSHPFLSVLLDTRVYNDGQARLDVTMENILNVKEATSVVYNASIVADGNVIWSHDSITHWYLTRWRKVFAINSLVESNITPDFEPFIQAKAIPRYLDLVSNTVSSPDMERAQRQR